MKKVVIAIFSALIIVSLCSCAVSEKGINSTYTINKHGIDYIVDPENGTISDGTYTYQYEFHISSGNYSIDIIYPDGSAYWWRAQSSGGVTDGHGGWSDDYDAGRYADGRILCDVLGEKVPRTSGDAKVFLVFFLLVGGIFHIVWPHIGWYLAYGWRFKGAEPSALTLTMNRFGGIIVVIAAIALIFT